MIERTNQYNHASPQSNVWTDQNSSAALPGLVGAGGIGLQLQGLLNTLAWPQVSLILITIFVAVIISEWVSAVVRRAII